MVFSGSPVAETPRFQCRRHEFEPWLGNYDPICDRVGLKKKRKHMKSAPSSYSPGLQRSSILNEGHPHEHLMQILALVMYGCESWTINKAERRRIDAFELWCWRRLLRVPWTARRLNQSILKEISPEYSLEGLMLKLKLQYFGHLMRRSDSLEKTLMLGGIEGRRRRG